MTQPAKDDHPHCGLGRMEQSYACLVYTYVLISRSKSLEKMFRTKTQVTVCNASPDTMWVIESYIVYWIADYEEDLGIA